MSRKILLEKAIRLDPNKATNEIKSKLMNLKVVNLIYQLIN